MAGLLVARFRFPPSAARTVVQPVRFRKLVVTRQINSVSGSQDHDQSATITAATARPPSTGPRGRHRRRYPEITRDERLARFNDLLAFVAPRLGRRPDVKTPLVRQSAWTHLLRLAATPEQLEQVTALFPRWRDSRRVFDAHHADIFARRCQQLHCPSLAMRVFGDHSKYGLALSLPAARTLLHAVHVEHPLADTLAAAALFRAHGLPAPSEDLVSCAMLVSACFGYAHKQQRTAGTTTTTTTTTGEAEVQAPTKKNRKRGEDALRVAEALVPSLRRLLVDEGPVSVPKDATKRVRVQTRPKVWLMRTMEKIEKALAAQGSSEGTGPEWVREWRIRSRHISGP